MREIVGTLLLVSLAGLAGCKTNPGDTPDINVSFRPPEAVRLVTPLGTLEFSFGAEQKRVVSTGNQLATQSSPTKDSQLFRQFDFDTGPLPEGCKPFETGRYGRFVFPNDGAAIGAIRKNVETLKSDTGAPDEAVIALAIYEARAFQSLCGPATLAKLKRGSQINGWALNERAVARFKASEQEEIDVTSKIVIIALDKKQFEGRLKPNAVNVLLSKFRYELPPNSDSLAFDPKTGATVLAYSMDYQNVTIGKVTRDVLSGGFLRIFVGKTYIYLIDFTTNTAGVSENMWNAYKQYAESFRYVGDQAN
jgi:hypothetical protein